MKTLDLGKVAISPKGVYNADSSYDPLDLIQYNGSAYLVKKSVTGITPNDGEDYMLLVQKGAPGPSGADGVGKKVCRFTIGTSAAGYTVNDVDYLCDGINDQVEIQAAIDAVPDGGGEIVLLDGEYEIISLKIYKDNISLTGSGCRVVKGRFPIIVTGSYCTISGIIFNAGQYPIQLIDGSHNIIKYCKFGGMIPGNIYIKNSGYNIIESCHKNGGSAFIEGDLQYTSIGNIIHGNIIENCTDGFFDPTFNCSKNIIFGNIVLNTAEGIRIIGDMNAVFGNFVMRGNGDSSDYTSTDYTIIANGSNNLIANNMIWGKNYIDAGTGNTWVNNKYN